MAVALSSKSGGLFLSEEDAKQVEEDERKRGLQQQLQRQQRSQADSLLKAGIARIAGDRLGATLGGGRGGKRSSSAVATMDGGGVDSKGVKISPNPAPKKRPIEYWTPWKGGGALNQHQQQQQQPQSPEAYDDKVEQLSAASSPSSTSSAETRAEAGGFASISAAVPSGGTWQFLSGRASPLELVSEAATTTPNAAAAAHCPATAPTRGVPAAVVAVCNEDVDEDAALDEEDQEALGMGEGGANGTFYARVVMSSIVEGDAEDESEKSSSERSEAGDKEEDEGRASGGAEGEPCSSDEEDEEVRIVQCA